VADPAAVSYWLESCGDDLTPRPPLDGSRTADVAILGAGFSGLWTAHSLLQRDPSLRVVVVEREIAGFGASGRNGAWCTSGFGAGPEMLTRRYGADSARAVHHAMVDTVDEVGRVCVAEGIDAHYQRDGELLLAIGAHQLPALDAIERTYDELGLGDFHRRLDATETRATLAVDGAVGALHHPATAAVHPGRLVRGLARAVERRGGVIHELTAATAFSASTSTRRAVLHTNRGDIDADAIVLCGEAYLTELRPLHRALLPVYSLIVLTEPLPASTLEAIGWTHRMVTNSRALVVDYLSRTADGRILFGGRGAPYHYGSRIRRGYDHHDVTHDRLRRSIAEWFPTLAGVSITHAWGGCLGIPRDYMPSASYDPRTGLATARGYTGEGVAATNLLGRTVADLITARESPLTGLPFVNHRSRSWEPEPLRWLGVRVAQRGAERIDAEAARRGRAPSGRSLTERVVGRLIGH
jgi:glycine/D-amino acid oxidase-like deaminating enzyme